MLRVFGEPAQTFHFGQYTVMVWHQNLLTHLESIPSTQDP
jgi:hypothetical protein